MCEILPGDVLSNQAPQLLSSFLQSTLKYFENQQVWKIVHTFSWPREWWAHLGSRCFLLLLCGGQSQVVVDGAQTKQLIGPQKGTV